jgi:hypothetical protein
MKFTDAVRLNVTIHPEKDPALFDYIMSISNKEARPRRLINLAQIGLFVESSNNTRRLVTPVENIQSSHPQQLMPTQSNKSPSNKSNFDEGELDSLGSLFEL